MSGFYPHGNDEFGYPDPTPGDHLADDTDLYPYDYEATASYYDHLDWEQAGYSEDFDGVGRELHRVMQGGDWDENNS
jgi:hypothetical protein